MSGVEFPESQMGTLVKGKQAYKAPKGEPL